MLIAFDQDYLRELYQTGQTKDKRHRYQPQVVKGYIKAVDALKAAKRIEDLYPFKGLNFEALQGDKKGIEKRAEWGGGVRCVDRLCRVERINPTLPTALVYHDLSLVNVGLHSFLQVLISVWRAALKNIFHSFHHQSGL